MPFNRDIAKQTAAALASKGVFIGMSGWKYEGWFGPLYGPSRPVPYSTCAITRHVPSNAPGKRPTSSRLNPSGTRRGWRARTHSSNSPKSICRTDE